MGLTGTQRLPTTLRPVPRAPSPWIAAVLCAVSLAGCGRPEPRPLGDASTTLAPSSTAGSSLDLAPHGARERAPAATARPNGSTTSAGETSAAPPVSSATPVVGGTTEPNGNPDPLADAAWSPDRKQAITIDGPRLLLWATEQHTVIDQLELDSVPKEVVWSKDGKTLYLGHENDPPTSLALRADRKVEERSFPLSPTIHPETDRGTSHLTLSPDGLWLVAVCATVEFCAWNTRTREVRRGTRPPTANGAVQEVSGLELEAAGRVLLLRSSDGTTERYDFPSLRLLNGPAPGKGRR